MKKSLRYSCPHCGQRDEVLLRRFVGQAEMGRWNCPVCGQALKTERTNDIWIGIFDTILLGVIVFDVVAGPVWIKTVLYVSAALGIRLLLSGVQVVEDLPPRDFVKEEIGGAMDEDESIY